MKRLFAGLAFGLMSSCGFIESEIYSSGGYVGEQAQNFIPAQTQQQRLDRYLIVAIILAPAALETAVDEEDASATIRRVNALYGSLANLLDALKCDPAGAQTQNFDAVPRGDGDPRVSAPNRYILVFDSVQAAAEDWGEVEDEFASTPYSFEQLEYEVQQDLFFIARAVVTNLNLDTSVDSLLSLNALTLARLWTKVNDLMPMVRETAARFRGGVILYADIAQASCRPLPGTPCTRLRQAMAEQYRGADTNFTFQENDVRQMLDLARRAFDGEQWRMTAPQYIAVLSQIDQSCTVAFHRQSEGLSDEEVVGLPKCGADSPDGSARARLITALKGSTT